MAFEVNEQSRVGEDDGIGRPGHSFVEVTGVELKFDGPSG